MTCEVKPETGKFVNTIFYQLFTDLELALSFLRTAKLMPSGKTKQFYELHALRIHGEASQMISKMRMPPDTRDALSKKLLSVNAQLDAQHLIPDRRAS